MTADSNTSVPPSVSFLFQIRSGRKLHWESAGGMMILAVRCGGRITPCLDQPGAGKWEPDGKLRLCDATAESETAHPATKVKVKSRGKKGGTFSCLSFSPLPPNRECLRVGWAVGAEENKNPHSARGSGRFASKQGPRKLSKGL